MKIKLNREQVQKDILPCVPLGPDSLVTVTVGLENFDSSTFFENVPPEEPIRLFEKLWPNTSVFRSNIQALQKLVLWADRLEEYNERSEILLRKWEQWGGLPDDAKRTHPKPDRAIFDNPSAVSIRSNPQDLASRVQRIIESL